MVKIKTDLIRRKMDDQKLTMTTAAMKAGIPYQSFCVILLRGSCNGTTLGKLARMAGVKAYELVDAS